MNVLVKSIARSGSRFLSCTGTTRSVSNMTKHLIAYDQRCALVSFARSSLSYSINARAFNTSRCCRLASESKSDDDQQQKVIETAPAGNNQEDQTQPRMAIAFTCGVCSERVTRTFFKQSYEKGVVVIKCPACCNHHIIADNLGWHPDWREAGFRCPE